MKVKTSELTGAALNAAVALALGAKEIRLHTYRGLDEIPPVWVVQWEHGWEELLNNNYCEEWTEGGPIIERYDIAITRTVEGSCAYCPTGTETVSTPLGKCEVIRWGHKQVGPTPLIAAMRSYVASTLGDEVELPDALMEDLN